MSMWPVCAGASIQAYGSHGGGQSKAGLFQRPHLPHQLHLGQQRQRDLSVCRRPPCQPVELRDHRPQLQYPIKGNISFILEDMMEHCCWCICWFGLWCHVEISPWLLSACQFSDVMWLNSALDIVDIKPANMEELTEVITAAEFHPLQCNTFVYSSSKGTIRCVTCVHQHFVTSTLNVSYMSWLHNICHVVYIIYIPNSIYCDAII